MTTRIRNFSLVTVAALILALSACGGGGGSNGPVTDTGPPTTPEPPLTPEPPSAARLPDWPVDPQVVGRGQALSLDPIPTVPFRASHHRSKETRNTINLGFIACGSEGGGCYYEDDPVVSYRGIDFVQQRGVFLKEDIGYGIDNSEDIYWHYYYGYLDSGRVLEAGKIFNSGYNQVNVTVRSDSDYSDYPYFSQNEIRRLHVSVDGGGSLLWTDSFGGYILSGRYFGAMLGVDIDNGNLVMGDAAISGQLVEFVGLSTNALPVFDARFTNVLDLSSGRRYADIEGEIGHGGLIVIVDEGSHYGFDRGDFIAASIDFVRGNDEAVGSFETDDLIGVFGATRQ